jgi:hypothetical protein
MVHTIYLENLMDQQQNPTKRVNPLAQWFRQPKIYISFPSGGEFYPPNALDKSANGEYAVYAMTAKDELMLKTPDALMSGQSTVEVIRSCIPAIVDPWLMPSIDLDAALLAIRIATYGEKMEVSVDCPSCNEENAYDVGLIAWLDKIRSFKFETQISYEPLTIFIRPYTYREVTKTGLKTFEQQRILSIVNDENISDEVKIEKFSESFVKLTSLTVDTIAECVWKVTTPDGETIDRNEITEFIRNSPKEVFDKISNHIMSMKENMEIGSQDVTCVHCKTPFTMPVELDQASFFVQRS